MFMKKIYRLLEPEAMATLEKLLIFSSLKCIFSFFRLFFAHLFLLYARTGTVFPHQCMFWHEFTVIHFSCLIFQKYVSTQIAAMTTLHIHLNGNYLSKHTVFPVDALALQETTVWTEYTPRPWLSVPLPHVSQSVECQLIRLFSSCAGSSFSALQRSGSIQHCVCFVGTQPWMDYRCHNEAMKTSGGRSSQILELNTSTSKSPAFNFLRKKNYYYWCNNV